MTEEAVETTEEQEPNELEQQVDEVQPEPEEKEGEPEQKKTESDDDFETRKAKWQEKVDKRIAKLTAQKYQEVEARKKAEDRIKELETLNAAYEVKSKLATEEPHRDDFDIEEDYLKALGQWNYKMGRAQEKHQEAHERYQKIREAEKPAPQPTEHPLSDAFTEGRAKYQDFDKTVLENNTNPVFTNANMANYTIDILADSDNAHEVLYYLGKHEAEASRISRLSPPAFAREIGKIEARLAEKQAPPKKTTKAPPPLKPVKGAEPAVGDIDPDKDPIGWIKARNEGRI